MNWFLSLTFYSQIISLYLIAINLIAFFVYGIDKAKSQLSSSRRISEKMLWLLALIGGSLGSLLAMKLFRHKTKKLSFQAMMAVILAIQLVGVLIVLSV
ncbi:MAG: DUF1294 domain-containing protein [Candidatus Magasanikbacteria bacterium]|nr:DUF1294 domain-containing protein [Candidatus Magasanikbacteria bacterium]